MNQRAVKATRRQVAKKQRALMKDAMREIMGAPIKTRLAFCWMVLKGKK